jgi:predicted XRE-type DNA-binding protein
MAHGLHRPPEGGRLRIARLSEKIQIGDRYPEEGNRPDSSPVGNCRERIRKGRLEMKKRKKFAKEEAIKVGSGNIFADLGLPNSGQELQKAELTLQIYRIIKQRNLTQTQAGKILGISQPHVSALARNRAGNFSIGRLLDFLTALGQNVQITVKPARKAQGEMSIVLA